MFPAGESHPEYLDRACTRWQQIDSRGHTRTWRGVEGWKVETNRFCRQKGSGVYNVQASRLSVYLPACLSVSLNVSFVGNTGI